MSEEGKYVCPVCGKRFSTKAGLKGHIRWVHEYPKMKEALEKGNSGEGGNTDSATTSSDMASVPFREENRPILPNIRVSEQREITETPTIVKRREIDIEGIRTAPPRTVAINPNVYMLYSWAKAQGYEGDLSDFVNECVETLFRQCGIVAGVFRINKSSNGKTKLEELMYE